MMIQSRLPDRSNESIFDMSSKEKIRMEIRRKASEIMVEVAPGDPIISKLGVGYCRQTVGGARAGP